MTTLILVGTDTTTLISAPTTGQVTSSFITLTAIPTSEVMSTAALVTSTGFFTTQKSATPVLTPTPSLESTTSDIITVNAPETLTTPSSESPISSIKPPSLSTHPTSIHSSISPIVTIPASAPVQSTQSTLSAPPSSLDSGPTTFSILPSSVYASYQSSSYITAVSDHYTSYTSVIETSILQTYSESAQYTPGTYTFSTTTKSAETVLPPTATPSSAAASSSPLATVIPSAPQHHKSPGLSTGAKIGIGVGIGLTAIALLALIAILFDRRRRRRQGRQTLEPEYEILYLDPPELDDTNSEQLSHHTSPSWNQSELGSSPSEYNVPTARTPANNLYRTPGVATRYEPQSRTTKQRDMNVAEMPGTATQHSLSDQSSPMHPLDATELEG